MYAAADPHNMDTQQLQEFAGVCESAQLMRDGTHDYIYLKRLRVRVGGDNHVVDALLSPTTHSGYTTRLFLSQPFPGKAANWTMHQILGRSWHTWSWQGVPSELPAIRILLCHLDALK